LSLPLQQRNRQLSHRPVRKFRSVLLFAKSSPENLWGKTSAVQSREMQPAGSLSFPKGRRLTQTSEYERVKQDGFVRGGKLLTLNVLQVEQSGPWRAGFITSRRIGSAVVRNRVRRRLREIVRRRQHDLREGVWIVLVARKDAATADYRALEHEWLRLARRASILL
jgi:ribonuclease P protein component